MGDHSDETWFDREICPCGMMHERYACCGTPVDACGLENRHATAILTDLIAELREGYESDPYLGGWHLRAVAMMQAADRAEARLRELDAPPNSTNEHNNLGGGRR